MGLGIGSMEGLIDYDVLATKIALRMSKAPKESEVLWDAKECADYLHFKKRYFAEKLAKQSGFPKTRGTGALWLKANIVRWAKG